MVGCRHAISHSPMKECESTRGRGLALTDPKPIRTLLLFFLHLLHQLLLLLLLLFVVVVVEVEVEPTFLLLCRSSSYCLLSSLFFPPSPTHKHLACFLLHNSVHYSHSHRSFSSLKGTRVSTV